MQSNLAAEIVPSEKCGYEEKRKGNKRGGGAFTGVEERVVGGEKKTLWLRTQRRVAAENRNDKTRRAGRRNQRVWSKEKQRKTPFQGFRKTNKKEGDEAAETESEKSALEEDLTLREWMHTKVD